MADVPLGLLQALGDIGTEEKPSPEAPVPTPAHDPVIEMILADPYIDPQTKAILRTQEQNRRTEARLQMQLEKLRSQDKEEPGLISWLGPVPIGFQLGTFAGIKNPVMRFLTDVIVDPVNLLSFGATTYGRAVLSGSKWLRGLSMAEKAEAIGLGAKVLGSMKVDEELAATLLKATEVRDFKTIASSLKDIRKAGVSADVLSELGKIPEAADLLPLIRGDKETVRGLEAVLKLGDKADKVRYQAGFLNRVAEGQSAFLKFGIPFTDYEFATVRFPELLKSFGIRTMAEGVNIPRAAEALEGIAKELKPLQVLKGGSLLEKIPTSALKLFSEVGQPAEVIARFGPKLGEALKAGEMAMEAIEGAKAVNLKTLTTAYQIPGETVSQALKLAMEGLKPGFGVAKAMDLEQALRQVEAIKGGKLAEFLKKVAGKDAQAVQAAFRRDPQSVEAFRNLLKAEVTGQGIKQLVQTGKDTGALERSVALIGQAKDRIVEVFKEYQAAKNVGERSLRRSELTGLATTFAERVGVPMANVRRIILSAPTPESVSLGLRDLLKSRAKTLLGKLGEPAINFGERAKAAIETTSKLGGGGNLPLGSESAKAVKGLVESTLRSDSGANIMEFSREVSSFHELISGAYLEKAYGAGANTWAKTAESAGVVMQNYWNGVNRAAVDLQRRFLTVIGGDEKFDKLITQIREAKGAEITKLPESLRAVMGELDHFFDETFAQAVRTGVLDQEQFVDSYVSHLVDWKDEKLRRLFYRQAVRSLSRELPGTRFSQSRVFNTIQDLKEFQAAHPNALTLRTEKMSDVIGAYARGMGLGITRNDALKFVMGLKNSAGQDLVVSLKDLPENVMKRGVLPNGASLVKDYKEVENDIFKNWLFHRDIAPYFNSLFDRDLLLERRGEGLWDKAVRGLQWVNDFGKSALFRLSPFHFVSLGLSSFMLLPFREAVGVNVELLKTFRRTPEEAFDAFYGLLTHAVKPQQGAEGAMNAFDLYKRFAFVGGKLGRGDLGAFDHFGTALKQAAEKAPGPLRSPITGLAHVNNVLDKNLWEIYQNGLKFLSWTHLRQAELIRNPDLFKNTEKLFKTETDLATVVNQVFGGLGWEKMLVSPRTQAMLRFVFIAPDWTISNLLMARDLFVNMPGVRNTALMKAISRDVLLPDLRFRYALQFNLRAGLYMFFGSNLMNYLFNGKFLWDADKSAYDPDTGIPRVELPYTNHNGQKQYMDTYRQFIEPWQLFKDPLSYYGSKMGALPRIFRTLIVGRDSYGRPVYGAENGPYREIVRRIGETTGQFVPIPVSSLAQVAGGTRDIRSAAIASFGFPVRSEPSQEMAKRARIQAIETQLQTMRGR